LRTGNASGRNTVCGGKKRTPGTDIVLTSP
jgi:hypothetical protein